MSKPREYDRKKIHQIYCAERENGEFGAMARTARRVGCSEALVQRSVRENEPYFVSYYKRDRANDVVERVLLAMDGTVLDDDIDAIRHELQAAYIAIDQLRGDLRRARARIQTLEDQAVTLKEDAEAAHRRMNQLTQEAHGYQQELFDARQIRQQQKLTKLQTTRQDLRSVTGGL